MDDADATTADAIEVELRRNPGRLAKLLAVSLGALAVALALWWANRATDTDAGMDYSSSRRVRTPWHVPSVGTLTLYGGSILMALVGVAGCVAVAVGAARGVLVGKCPGCGGEVDVARGAADVTCPGCRRRLKTTWSPVSEKG